MFKIISYPAEFYDDLRLEVAPFDRYLDNEFIVERKGEENDEEYTNKITIKEGTREKEYSFVEAKHSVEDELLKQRYKKRAAKRAVYEALSEYTGVKLPWGSLTGIRPTHLAYEYLNHGGDKHRLAEYLEESFGVSPKRARLIYDIIEAQRKYLNGNSSSVNFYIHIPFCPSRCSYCSFTSLDYQKANKMVEPYIEVLLEEIYESCEIIEKNGYKVDSVYIGGGTPTSLDPELLRKVLDAVPFRDVEYTLEAGRPDTITEEKLEICRQFGVTRISVNPQTLDENVLSLIGRHHAACDFFNAFAMAKKAGFIINTDLIAGLPSQSMQIFQNDVETVAKLGADNITVHTLSIKNGSAMKNSAELPRNDETEAMMNFAIDSLTEKGYIPYYLYRQKNMLGNLENIGFTLDGCQCRNNITTMEETLSVIACGAGAIGKRIFAGGRIERLSNLHDVKLYIEQGKERFFKKRIFYSNQFTI